MLKEITSLFRKELQLEWKQKYAMSGLVLYVFCMVVVISLAFVDGVQIDDEYKSYQILNISSQAWNILFWIILLFVAINAITKSFSGERSGQMLYLYGLVRPEAVVLSKIFYNSLLLILIGFVTLFFHALLGAASIKNYGLFALAIVLGGIAFSATLTIVSALSAKAENTSTLVAVISFPLIIPMLSSLIMISQAAMDGLYFVDVSDRISMVLGVSIALSGLSVILFPFVWRD